MAKKKEDTEMKIEMWDIDDITPFKNNAKKHPESQVEQIAVSIASLGFNDPVAVDTDGVIIEGHGRILAARKLNLRKIPVIVLSHLDEADKRAYILAHNKLTMNTGFDKEMLASELEWLDEQEFDLELTGMSNKELDKLLGSVDDGNTQGENDAEKSQGGDEGDEEETDNPTEGALCSPGDVWYMGDHILTCGEDVGYCERIITRWEKHAGQDATLEQPKKKAAKK